MTSQRNVVAYCPVCGHSHFGGDLLAEGSDGCQALIVGISIDEWRAIAKVHSLHLTEAGRLALAQEGEKK